MLSEVIKRREEHVKRLQAMKNTVQDSENWEQMMPIIESLIAGGMALQVLNDPMMLAKHLQDHCNSYAVCDKCPMNEEEYGCRIGSELPETWDLGRKKNG